jgi:hypothetical protein
LRGRYKRWYPEIRSCWPHMKEWKLMLLSGIRKSTPLKERCPTYFQSVFKDRKGAKEGQKGSKRDNRWRLAGFIA